MTPISSLRGGRNWSGGLWKRMKVGAVQRPERKRISVRQDLEMGLGTKSQQELS